MDKDDIIRMAREAGFADGVAEIVGLAGFERLVELARADEREAIAKMCDDMEEKAEGTECCKWPTPADCAAAIRVRGNT